ncbi:MAG TPA: DinB family protein [Gemmatimonadales bacterium]|jgi:uncharacterized damage-inducible protein DinB|nr:DinB family protein [Gemmatimonadales bacterium]
MPISQMFLPEFDQEMATTRRILERVPEGKSDWKPHPKSMTLGRLAGHVSELPGWGVVTLDQTELDFAPSGGPVYEPATFTDRATSLKRFDDGVKACRDAITRSSDADFMVMWTLKRGGQKLMSMPRAACLRSMVLNHIVHHRAQLGVYLRLNDVPLPSSYGPTADEPRM